LFLTTGKDEYKQYLLKNEKIITDQVSSLGWMIGRVLGKINDKTV